MQFLCETVNVNNVGTFPLVVRVFYYFQTPFGSAERGRVCAASCIWSLGGGGEERGLRDAQSRTVRLEVFFSFFFGPDATVCNSIVAPRNISECFPA